MSRMTRVLLTLFAALLLPVAVTVTGATAVTSSPPSEFGNDWDDPQTAQPPVAVPDSQPCQVQVLHHVFDDYATHTFDYAPPARCGGAWSKVVLHLDGSVAGRQYDRLGYLDIGGVRVLTTSTPEPSPDGISWHVQKDVTDLAPLLRKPQQAAMYLGNTVDSTYTGRLDITVTLDFYKPGKGFPAAKTADQVLPLSAQQNDGTDLTGSLSVPQNTTRLEADVFATGSGGGCEEFWDTSAPSSTGYSCSDGLPYREVDVLVDGRLAGVALPYPVVYTGGWSNPYLWAATPSPNAFDIPALHYDLTPFAGLLDDGRPHAVRLQVQGVPQGGGGWTLAPRFRVWTDPQRSVVHGDLTSYDAPDAAVTSTVTGHDDLAGSVDLTGDRTFSATGYVDTSAGRVTTTVHRTLANTSRHTWTDGESQDVLHADWRDTASSSTSTGGGPATVSTQVLHYGKDGEIDFVPDPAIDGGYDITTTLTIGYGDHETTIRQGRTQVDRTAQDTFDGTARWIYGVPRDQRHATADTTERYTLTGDPAIRCFDHTLRAVNGYFVEDRNAC